MQELV